MTYLDFYYALRPLIPRSLQIRLRQGMVRRSRASAAEKWPILESAGTRPRTWQGWPGGKKFALVLTHDNESKTGHDRTRSVMDLEERMGFRSCFGFVPERYAVSAELRKEVGERGFEVVLHGLRHDGRLFKSQRVFRQRLPAINDYLREWKAVGFRSPSMIHNLAWIRDLDIEYDSSTFDTDPFEPQPQEAGTIFPFWVSGTDRSKGYMELPYTLPQDFTLFTLMGEQSIDIWKKKLDWIAERGGMALLNTHPDYMSNSEKGAGLGQYPIDRYIEFLEYARSKYADQYWHALPRDVARFLSQEPRQVATRTLRRVCMMAYAFYDTDNRIIRYAETLTQLGDEVHAISLRRDGQKPHSVVNNVQVHRIQRRQRDEKGRMDYLFRILRFWIKSFVTISRQHLKNPYDLVHVHSVPDFEVFAAWLPKRLGAKVILDIHDLVPEFYASKFDVSKDSTIFRALARMERASTSFADHVIISNDLWQNTLASRSVPPAKCSVILNYPDPDIFHPHKCTRTDKKFIILYPGGLQWHQGLDIAIRAFSCIEDQLPNVEFHIYGEGNAQPDLEELVRQLKLGDKVRFKKPVMFHQVPQVIANADLGVVPKRADGFGNEAYSTKILEFMSQGLPVVASKTKIDAHYFNDSVIKFFAPGDESALADAMLSVIQDDAQRGELSANGLRFFQNNNWSLKKDHYLRLVDKLAGGHCVQTVEP